MNERIEFQAISKKNPQIYVEGYVDVYSEDAEWNFWNGTQYQSRIFYHYDGITIEGITDEQDVELLQFESDYVDSIEWMNDIIYNCTEDENRTFENDKIVLHINDGGNILIKDSISDDEIDDYRCVDVGVDEQGNMIGYYMKIEGGIDG